MRWILRPACVMYAAVALYGQPVDSLATVIRTQSGPVRAVAPNVVAFKGIPYAAAPTGNRRWRPPVLPEPWTEIRDARQFGPQCPQPNNTFPGAIPRAPARTSSEDCLTLNIWTPATSSGKRLPVMVWFHGGGFTIGSGAARDGEELPVAEWSSSASTTVLGRWDSSRTLTCRASQSTRSPEITDCSIRSRRCAGFTRTSQLLVAIQRT